jgi:hypothetical protein
MGFMSLSCHCRLTRTFRRVAFPRDRVVVPCMPCWSGTHERLDWSSIGPRTCLIRGAPWLLRSGSGGIGRTIFPPYTESFLKAHFVLGEDLEDPAVIDSRARGSGIDLAALHAAFADGSAIAAVADTETIARDYGVQGTPAWLLVHQLINGLLPAAEFERLAQDALQLLK